MEKAEKKLSETRATLDKKLIECLEEVQPAFDSWSKTKLQIIAAIADYAETHKIAKKNQPNIVAYCLNLAQEIYQSPYRLSDEEQTLLKESLGKIDPDIIRDNYNENPTLTAEELRAETLARAIERIKLELEMMGHDIDLSDINSSMSDEEIASIIEERISKVDKSFKPNRQKKKSKTKQKKEAEKQKFDELKDKSFSSMYKNLVKLIHPDSEPNEDLKERKTEWMKRLTVAYKNKDIKTLLTIELEWLSGAKDAHEKMSEDKLTHFNELLNAQIKKIDQQADMLYSDHRYYPLIYFAQGKLGVQTFQPKVCRNQITREHQLATQHIASLRNAMQTSAAEAKAIIKQIVAS